MRHHSLLIFLSLLVNLLLSTTSYAQTSSERAPSEPSNEAQTTKELQNLEPNVSLDRTTFFVPDFEKSFALYRDILGYEVSYNKPYQGSTLRKLFNIDKQASVDFAILRNPDQQGASIGLLATVLQEDEFTPPTLTDYRPEIGEAVLFTVTKNLDAIYQRVLAADSSIVTVVAPPFATNGGREMVIADPVGIRIYVFQSE